MNDIKITQQEYLFFLSQLTQISPYGYYFEYTYNSYLDLYKFKDESFFADYEKICGKDLDFQLQLQVALYNIRVKHLITNFWTDNMDKEHRHTSLRMATKKDKELWKNILEGKVDITKDSACSGMIIDYFNIVHLMYDYFIWIVNYFRKDKNILEGFIEFVKDSIETESIIITPIPCTKIMGLFCGIGEHADISKINYFSALIENKIDKYIIQNNRDNEDKKEYGWVHIYLNENCGLELHYFENGKPFKDVVFGNKNPTDKQIKDFYNLFFDTIEEGISYYFKNVFTRQFSEDYEKYLLNYNEKKELIKYQNKEENKKLYEYN
nr:MAG TPA: hypothetical protein [Caudoviricetes sp.]